MKLRLIAAIAVACTLLLSACATSGSGTKPKATNAAKPLADTAPATYERPCAEVPKDARAAHACDRRSILAMAGEFRVRFAFDETAALAPAYAPHAAQRSGATELVEVIVDEENWISLQHILVMKMGEDVHVIKHWRQDWHYEPASVLRFHGNGRFSNDAVPAAEAKGAWSQIVYEVDDAPRYAGIGRWLHADGVDAWTSDTTLRPLPRREYSKRKDYQALEVINRHTLTPAGWVHEQDNTKLVIDADGRRHAIARERGLNSYARIGDFDFEPGRAYWKKTAAYWQQVRAEWQRGFAAQSSFVLTPDPDGEPRITELFAQADRVADGEKVTVEEIDAVLVRYGLPLPGSVAVVEKP